MKIVLTKTLRHPGFEGALHGLFAGCALVGVVIVIGILGTALFNGWSRLSWSFLVDAGNAVGTSGGILYQIAGSAILLLTASLIVTPFACAIAVVDYNLSGRWHGLLRSFLHLLNATPSILFGILGFVFFVHYCDWDKSWLGGGCILGLMILPTVTLALVHRLETIPVGYTETALSLGLTSDQMIKSILIPYGWGGLLTGNVMGLARAAGETAPIMFTAVVFYGPTIPDGVVDNPVLALPYHIFNLAQDVLDPGALTSAWATAFVLICFVLLLSLGIAPFRSRGHEEAKL